MAGSTLSSSSSALMIAVSTVCLVMMMVFAVPGDGHYTDDSDYNDFDYYKDLPEKRPPGYAANDQMQDDFYIVSEPGETEDRSRRVASSSREDRGTHEGAEQWPAAERVYRYTKHRIPGYDYDELEFLESRAAAQRCDERSVWTHCLCQFTCARPNIVDCYTPCGQGCECREDYVYDERTRQCVLPDQCQPDDDYLLY